MKKFVTCSALLLLAVVSHTTYASNDIISQEAAIKSALVAIDVEVLGIRHDQPDSQWDVFIRKGEVAYEIEVNAVTGEVEAFEQETLAEIKSELSGNLYHEGTIGDVDK